jgi:hypothetical protein
MPSYNNVERFRKRMQDGKICVGTSVATPGLNGLVIGGDTDYFDEMAREVAEKVHAAD